jgi:hypothetical protein
MGIRKAPVGAFVLGLQVVGSVRAAAAARSARAGTARTGAGPGHGSPATLGIEHRQHASCPLALALGAADRSVSVLHRANDFKLRAAVLTYILVDRHLSLTARFYLQCRPRSTRGVASASPKATHCKLGSRGPGDPWAEHVQGCRKPLRGTHSPHLAFVRRTWKPAVRSGPSFRH